MKKKFIINLNKKKKKNLKIKLNCKFNYKCNKTNKTAKNLVRSLKTSFIILKIKVWIMIQKDQNTLKNL